MRLGTLRALKLHTSRGKCSTAEIASRRYDERVNGPSRGLGRAACGAWVALSCVAAGLLLTGVPRMPGNAFGLRAMVTPAIGQGLSLAQTFRMTSGGLRGVELSTVALTATPTGLVAFTLTDVTLPAQPLQVSRAEVPSARLAVADTFLLQFPPISSSMSRSYRIEVTSNDATTGVGLLATRGDRYVNGTLEANGRGRWADLVFRAQGTREPAWRTLATGHPEGPTVAAALGVAWLAVGLLFWSVAKHEHRSLVPVPVAVDRGAGN